MHVPRYCSCKSTHDLEQDFLATGTGRSKHHPLVLQSLEDWQGQRCGQHTRFSHCHFHSDGSIRFQRSRILSQRSLALNHKSTTPTTQRQTATRQTGKNTGPSIDTYAASQLSRDKTSVRKFQYFSGQPTLSLFLVLSTLLFSLHLRSNPS